MFHKEEHTVPTNLFTEERIQEYGVGIFHTVPTKSALKKALKKGYVTINGVVAKTATIIKGGEHIELIMPVQANKKQPNLSLKVLFEDDYFAAISKPPGILVSGNRFMTIANALPQNLKMSKLADASLPHPLHRLDYATTGVVLVGKTSASIRLGNELFANSNIQKSYIAITIGDMLSSGRIEKDLDGKPAITDYQVLDSVKSNRFQQLNLVKVQLHTGRTHQIRRHFAHLGHPILGDKDYALPDLLLKGKGMYLHAYKIEFNHPITNHPIVIEAPLPKKFLNIFPDFV